MGKLIKKKPEATFEIRFDGPGIEPGKVTPRALYDVLAALQDIASGRDPWDMPQVPPEKTIGLLDVKRGSARYMCLSHAPKEAVKNLARAAVLLTATVAQIEARSEEVVSILSALQSLSHVAKSLNCEVQVRLMRRQSEPLFVVQQGDYERVSKQLLISGETTVWGQVLRAGGATEMKCFLRVKGRRKGLYCRVQNRELVRRLGEHLYEEIAAQGTAVWLHGSWRIYSFTINDFSQPTLGDPLETIQKLRTAGLDAWDDIEDPEACIRESST